MSFFKQNVSFMLKQKLYLIMPQIAKYLAYKFFAKYSKPDTPIKSYH